MNRGKKYRKTKVHEDIAYNRLAMLGVGEADTNGLVNKEHIGVAVPGFFEKCWIVGCIGDSTGS